MLSALALLLTACAPEEPPEFCDSGVRHLYDPESEEILAFPDDIWTVPDPDSPTGLRVRADDAPWMAEVPDLLVGFMDGLEGATGFGRLGAAVLRFSDDIGPVPGGAEASVTDIAPTILAAYGLPPADDMDGRVLLEAMAPEFLNAHPIASIRTPSGSLFPGRDLRLNYRSAISVIRSL